MSAFPETTESNIGIILVSLGRLFDELDVPPFFVTGRSHVLLLTAGDLPGSVIR